jgi:hypothetical protein
MIDERIARELEELVPPGKRSKVVGEAIVKELAAIRRRQLTERLMELRRKSPVATTEELVDAVRKDRARG